MGANEKYDAAMHGYVPSTESVREEYRNGRQFGELYSKTDFRAEFDRWIEAVRAEAKAEALEEAADGLGAIDPGGDSVYWDGTYYQRVNDWLRARVNQHKDKS